jgi:hypothetical protein
MRRRFPVQWSNTMIKITGLLVAALTLGFLGGCGTSQTYHKITAEQRNEAWQQVPVKRIAVVAVTPDRGERIGSETVFADQLKQLGIDAIISHDFAPNLDGIDTEREAITALAERNVDAVLTIAVAQEAQGYDRTDYWAARGWATLLGSRNTDSWGNLADAASYWGQGEYSLDIGLWDAKSMNAIWHAQTDSNEWDEGSAGVSRLADFMAETLKSRGLIQP